MVIARVRGRAYFRPHERLKVVQLSTGYLSKQVGISVMESIVNLPESRIFRVQIKNATGY